MKLLTMSPQSILSKEQEQTPEWLMKYRAGRRFPRKKFFGSRIVYYPAAGADFQPLAIFGGAGAAHCFVMADYWITPQQVADVLSNAHFAGFVLDSLVRLPLEEVFKPNWTRHFDQDLIEEDERLRFFKMINAEGFAFMAIYTKEYHRLALLYLGFEAVEAYDRLFCQGRSPKPPYGILVQNHGMGGDWNQMANPDSYVAQLADEFGRPRWLIGQDNYENWRDYEPVSDITHGGMHSTARRLFLDSRIVRGNGVLLPEADPTNLNPARVNLSISPQ
jgi:hypothetical protein